MIPSRTVEKRLRPGLEQIGACSGSRDVAIAATNQMNGQRFDGTLRSVPSEPVYPRATRFKASALVTKIRRFLSSKPPSERNFPRARVTASRLAPIMLASWWWV